MVFDTKFARQSQVQSTTLLYRATLKRLFHDAVAPHVKRVIVVNASQFR